MRKWRIIAIDLGATKAQFGLLKNEVGHLGLMSTPASASSELLWNRIRNIIEKGDLGRIDALGLARAPGLDALGHIMSWPNRPDWVGYPLVPILEDIVQAPVAHSDDGLCATIWEASALIPRRTVTTVCLTFGTGLGIAAIKDGVPVLSGDGDVTPAHMPLGCNDQLCLCGRYRCTQTVLNGNYLFRAAEGDRSAVAATQRTLVNLGHYLSKNVGSFEIVFTGNVIENASVQNLLVSLELDYPTRLSNTPSLSCLCGAFVVALESLGESQKVAKKTVRDWLNMQELVFH